LREDADASRALAAWRAVVDLPVLDAPSQRLLPLLARRTLDRELRERVHGLYRHAWVTNQRLWQQATPVVDGLRARGIPTLLLKGAALLDVYGGDWGARPMYDIDLLVPCARASAALELLTELGWVPEQGQSAAWVRWRELPRRHAWGFTRDDGRIDLHWHVLSDSIGSRSDARFWAGARSIEVRGTETRALDLADLLVHVVVHGTLTQNAPPLQWLADSVMVLRAAPRDAPFADRVAVTARDHGVLVPVARALDGVGTIVDPALVAETRARVEQTRPKPIEHLRRVGEHTEAVRQLARHAAGRQGTVRGAVELVKDRLDLALTTRPIAALSYAATARSPRVARAWRSRGGSFVRTAVDDPPPVSAGTPLDFTLPLTLDRYGSIGWGRTEPGGATTRSGEARLVLPLGPALEDVDLVVNLALESATGEVDISVRANETRVHRANVPTSGVDLCFAIPAHVAGRFTPLELAIRDARLLRRSSIRVRLRSIALAPR
jgi:hypothetical protein